MAHFAQLNENNVVIFVTPLPDELELNGEEHLATLHGGVWKKTSYNTIDGKHLKGGTPYRKNYAGIGYTYDAERDAFIPPKPYASWILDEEKCQWKAPTEPTWTEEEKIGKYPVWNEETQSWDLVE